MMNSKSARTKSKPNFSEKELDMICLEQARRERDERIRYFRPNPAQLRFINEIGRGGAFIVINAGGNGSGKTYRLIAILGAFVWPLLAAECFAAPIFKNFPYPKKIWIVRNHC